MNIQTRIEKARGCGYRKPGGLYLVSGGFGRHCGALPIPLTVCPTCHAGIHPSRGWTWVDLQAIRKDKPCVQTTGPNYCDSCPFFKITKAGLLWVGEKFYPTPDHFEREGVAMGISRRVSVIPCGFKLGETWIAFAHRKAIPGEFKLEDEQTVTPGIFHLFKPTAIEYVVRLDDDKEKLEALEKRGITLIEVVRDIDQKEAA